MAKPMEVLNGQVMLISRLFLLNFLLLWQPGTGTPFDDSIDEVKRNGTLPVDEVLALRLLSQTLRSSSTQLSLSSSPQLSLSYPICSDNQDAEIRCGSSYNTENGSFRSVTEINLAGKTLDGYIDNSIGRFQNLERLNLDYNQLSRGIPSTLGQLQHLKYLDLSSNSLTGSIPSSLTKLQNLKYLDLSSNDLDGTIPSNLTGLQSLRILSLSGNKLTGRIPDSIRYCKNLTAIFANRNFLHGTINKNLGTLSSLKYLGLYYNSLSGRIPKALGKLSALQHLALDGNDLHGELPKELGKLTNLRFLFLTANNFTGTIPTTYENLTNLEVFAVSGNYLSGPIPDFIGKWANLTDLVLIGNNFSGNLPAEAFSLTKLEELWVSDVNNPGISFPKEVIPEANSLCSVVLRNCNINGPIPEYIGKWPKLSYLDLSFNNLNGSIPETFQNLAKLFLTRNMLTGLPSWITDPKKSNINRTTVDLSYNNFNVSCKTITCFGLQNVTIHPTRSFIDEMKSKKCRRKHNSLFINSGGEDVYYGKDHYHNDTSISSFNLSPSDDWAYSYAGDYLLTNFNASASVINSTCEITSAKAKIDNNFRLAPVSLTYYGLCLRKGKYIVTLYFAEALYSKSEDYSTSGKRVFDIYIQGMIAKKDVNIKEIYGKEHEGKQLDFPVKINHGSLEIQLFWAGKGSLYRPARNGPLISAVSITRVPRKLHGWEIALIIGCCILFLLLLLAFMWRMGWIGDRELRETKVEIGERTFTLKQIIRATKKFSPKMQLGSGRSGIVYRAELPDLTVAVKKLFTHSKAVDEIESEVYAKKALDLKHENLVNLIASYSRRHLILLIYEYMEHGSLGQVLFGSNPTVQIDWQKRFIICRGIAKGLKYLHERNPPIIHRNIKANNILLDASCNPKISDFGLAKLYEEENPYIAIGAGGDLLYMSPEYATRRAMTVKVDVYSFGILLLEIVSGRNNADYRANQETVDDKNLALLFKWIWNLDNGVAGGWQEHILLKYRPHFINGIPEFAGSLSPTWHGIVSAIFSTQNIANLLHANVGFKVGDGRNIRFWTDSWLGSATNLQLLFPRLYNLSLQQNTNLADIYNLTDASLNLSWRRTLRPRENCQRESLIAEVQRGLLFSDGADCKLWKFHSSGMYSAQSGRLFFDSLSVTENNHSLTLLWNGYAPPKVDVFIWLLLHGGLSTRSFLAERRIINYEESHCPFCCKETETINHLFHWCPITWSLWGRFLKWFGCSGCIHKDPNQNLQEWSGLINGKFQRHAITLLCKGLYWSIWIARNRLIFESKAPDWDMIFDLTFHRLAFWLKSSVTNFSYTGSDLFRNPECIMNWTN